MTMARAELLRDVTTCRGNESARHATGITPAEGAGWRIAGGSWLRMKFSEALLLLAAGTLGGIFSTVVSIASLVTYPALLALGVPPLSANMTNTVSLVLTGAGSVLGSKPELAGQGRRVIRLGIVTALGGAAGAAVLLLTPASTFTEVVPVLIGGASLVLLVQPRIKGLSPSARTAGTGWSTAWHCSPWPCTWGISAPPRASCCWWCSA